jgi:8-oxo-dGTP diphosphatase
MPFPKSPGVTADVVIPNARGEVLLIKRKNEPFKGAWALPGGFIEYGQETIEECAIREALEETGLQVTLRALLGVYSHPSRDPRGHTVTAVYVCRQVGLSQAKRASARDDASDLAWMNASGTHLAKIEIAFDHRKILAQARKQGYIGGKR